MANDLITKRSRLRAVAPKGFQGEHELDPSGICGAALEKGISVCNSKLEFLDALPPEQIDENSLYKVANALSGLTRANIEARRFEMERAGAIKIAFELLKTELRNHMKSNPELCEQLLAEAYTVSAKLEEE